MKPYTELVMSPDTAFPMTPTILIPTDDILDHSLVAGLPRWASDSPEMVSLTSDITARGLDQPLIVCRTDGGVDSSPYRYLLDGRHRLAAAKAAGLTTVPVIERPESEAMGIVLSSLVHRRHYTKSALAYVTWPMFATRAEKRGGNRGNQHKKLPKPNDSVLALSDIDQHKKLPKPNDSVLALSDIDQHKKLPKPNDSVLALSDIAEQIGVSEDLVSWAKKAHDIFRERPDLREQFEPSILSGDLGLNRFQAAVDGKLAYEKTGGKRTNPNPDQLLFQGFDLLKTRFGRWEKIAEGVRATIAAEWVRTVYDLPDDVQLRTYESLRAKFQ